MRGVIRWVVIFVGAGELLSQLFDVTFLHHLCKPLIMISLVVYYWVSTKEKEIFRSTILLTGLIFSWAGDVSLMFQGELFFILGLVAFLLAHVFYIFAYRHHQLEVRDTLQGIYRIRYSFPFILAGTGLIVILYPYLGSLKIPVIIYALVLVLMVLNSLFRLGRTNTQSFWLVFGGAVLFMVSDSLLAINKFMTPIDFSGFWIMLTYITAQFLIVEGLLSHEKD